MKSFIVKLHGVHLPFRVDAVDIQDAARIVRAQHPGQAFLIKEARA